jgi:hypothetical protein
MKLTISRSVSRTVTHDLPMEAPIQDEPDGWPGQCPSTAADAYAATRRCTGSPALTSAVFGFACWARSTRRRVIARAQSSEASTLGGEARLLRNRASVRFSTIIKD